MATKSHFLDTQLVQLVVSTHLKNISQNWNPAQVGIGMKIKNTVFETTIQYIIHSMGYPTETLTQITSAILLDVRSEICLSLRLPHLLRHDDNENNDDPGGCGIIYTLPETDIFAPKKGGFPSSESPNFQGVYGPHF